MPLNVMSASNMGIGEAGITAIFGYCVVFCAVRPPLALTACC